MLSELTRKPAVESVVPSPFSLGLFSSYEARADRQAMIPEGLKNGAGALPERLRKRSRRWLRSAMRLPDKLRLTFEPKSLR